MDKKNYNIVLNRESSKIDRFLKFKKTEKPCKKRYE